MLFAPPYYSDFTCIAEKCRHNCCIGWEIGIDACTLNRYRTFDGALGEALQDAITYDDNGDACFRLTKGNRCPMLNPSNLCRIISEKGEDALCTICAMHPRYRIDLSDRTEIGLGLCCEEAVRLILSDPRIPIPVRIKEEPRLGIDIPSAPQASDPDDAELLSLRDALITLLYDPSKPLSEALSRMTESLDASLAHECISVWEARLRGLSRLDTSWDAHLDRLCGEKRPITQVDLTKWEKHLRPFAAYLLNRYLPGAGWDYDIAQCVSFTAFSTYLLAALGASTHHLDEFFDLVRQFSAEIEYDEENLQTIFTYLSKDETEQMTSLASPCRPNDLSTRTDTEIACYDLLDSLGISYQQIDHAPAMTMEACASIDLALQTKLCKNLLLCNRQKTAFYLLLLPADKPFRTAEVSKQIGSSRLSFADGEDMKRLLGVMPGSLTMLGLMNDTDRRVTLLVDEALLQEETIGMHPCVNTASLRLRTSDAFGPLLSAMNHGMTPVKLDAPGNEGEEK